MARDKTEQVSQPTDPSADDVVAIDGAASRNAAHARDAGSSRDGGFLKRFGGR